MGNSASVFYACMTSLVLVLALSVFLIPGSSHEMQLVYSVVVLAASEIAILAVTSLFQRKESGTFLPGTSENISPTGLMIGGILFCLFIKALQVAPDMLVESIAFLLLILVSIRLYRYSSLFIALEKIH